MNWNFRPRKWHRSGKLTGQRAKQKKTKLLWVTRNIDSSEKTACWKRGIGVFVSKSTHNSLLALFLFQFCCVSGSCALWDNLLYTPTISQFSVSFQYHKVHLTCDQLLKIACLAKDKTVLWDTITTKGSGKYRGSSFPDEMGAIATDMGWTGMTVACCVLSVGYMTKVWKNLRDTINIAMWMYYEGIDKMGNIIDFKLPE